MGKKYSKSWAEALNDFVDDGSEKQLPWQRALAAFFGSFLFHLSLVTFVLSGPGARWPNFDVVLVLFLFILVLSCIFGVLIATGKREG